MKWPQSVGLVKRSFQIDLVKLSQSGMSTSKMAARARCAASGQARPAAPNRRPQKVHLSFASPLLMFVYPLSAYIIYICVIDCCSFLFFEHLNSYDECHRLLTVHTHDDFIVLPLREISPLAPCPNIPLSHIIRTRSEPVLAVSC